VFLSFVEALLPVLGDCAQGLQVDVLFWGEELRRLWEASSGGLVVFSFLRALLWVDGIFPLCMVVFLGSLGEIRASFALSICLRVGGRSVCFWFVVFPGWNASIFVEFGLPAVFSVV
jgi:hypothetical protein